MNEEVKNKIVEGEIVIPTQVFTEIIGESTAYIYKEVRTIKILLWFLIGFIVARFFIGDIF